MHDDTAFERQIGIVLDRMGGPGQTFDAMAIARAAAAPSPGWFPSLVGATRFVVAAAIVALFGGLLLAGALMQPRGDEMAPAAEIDPPPPTTTEELLADWVTEKVEPGVVRVVNDGFRDLAPLGRDPGRELALGEDGSVWLWSDGTLQRLGAPEREPPIVGPRARGDVLGDLFIGDLLIDSDGVPWAGGWEGVYRLDGDAWTPVRSGYSRFDISPDGTLWSAWPGGSGGVSRLTPSGWEDHAIDLDLASALRVDPGTNIYAVNPQRLIAAPDGSVWVGMAVEVAPREYGHLLLRFDGEAWSASDPLDVGSYSAMTIFDIGPDGTAWVYLDQGDLDDPHLARLSDGTWTVYASDDGVEPIGIAGEAEGYMEVDQTGTLWVGGEWRGLGSCGGVRSFDGSRWHRYLGDVCVLDLDIAPDGAVWVVGTKDPPMPGPPRAPVTGDTYRIDPASAEAGEGSP
jgi:hypothetical protein